jgi:hypothetical protein
MLSGAAALLAVVSLYAIFRDGDKPPLSGSVLPPGRTGAGPSGSPPLGGGSSAGGPAAGSSQAGATSAGAASASATSAASSAGGPRPCQASQLAVAAATDALNYRAGARPMLALVVTNQGRAPCVTDLSDRQIELRVFNGSARVWGSDDCLTEAGSKLVILPVGQHIRREIQWSGLSSLPHCAGIRQRAAPGRYTLFATLAGRSGRTAKFALAG